MGIYTEKLMKKIDSILLAKPKPKPKKRKYVKFDDDKAIRIRYRNAKIRAGRKPRVKCYNALEDEYEKYYNEFGHLEGANFITFAEYRHRKREKGLRNG